jgi:hypothetical protein
VNPRKFFAETNLAGRCVFGKERLRWRGRRRQVAAATAIQNGVTKQAIRDSRNYGDRYALNAERLPSASLKQLKLGRLSQQKRVPKLQIAALFAAIPDERAKGQAAPLKKIFKKS